MNDVKRHATQSHVQSASGIVASAKAEIREVLPEQVEDLVTGGRRCCSTSASATSW